MEKRVTSHNLSIITFNTFGVPFDGNKIFKSFLRTSIRKRFKVIGKLLNNSDADIIALQEIYTFTHLNILKKELSNYSYCYYKKFLIAPRGGVVTFSKFPMEEVEYSDFKHKGNWYNKSFVGKMSGRGLLITKIKGHPIYIGNTHLTQNSDEEFKESNKFYNMLESQLKDITDVVNLLSMNNQVILTGDFNLPKNIHLYNNFLSSTKLIDTFGGILEPTKHKEFLFAKDYLECIDYIFVTKSAGVSCANSSHLFTEKAEISKGLLSYLSDHIALKVDISFNTTSLETPKD